MVSAGQLHLREVGLVDHTQRRGGEPDEAAPPRGEAKQAAVNVRRKDLHKTESNISQIYRIMDNNGAHTAFNRSSDMRAVPIRLSSASSRLSANCWRSWSAALSA